MNGFISAIRNCVNLKGRSDRNGGNTILKIAPVIYYLLIIISFVQCSAIGGGSPVSVVKTFFKSIKNNDIELMKQCVPQDMKEVLESDDANEYFNMIVNYYRKKYDADNYANIRMNKVDIYNNIDLRKDKSKAMVNVWPKSGGFKTILLDNENDKWKVFIYIESDEDAFIKLPSLESYIKFWIINRDTE